MTPEQKLAYEMTLSANALAVKNENKKIQEATLQKASQVVTKLLLKNKNTIEDIADVAEVSIEFVKSIQQKLSDDK